MKTCVCSSRRVLPKQMQLFFFLLLSTYGTVKLSPADVNVSVPVWFQRVRRQAGGGHPGGAGEGTRQRGRVVRCSRGDDQGAEGEDLPDTWDPETGRQWKRDGDQPCQGNVKPSATAFGFRVSSLTSIDSSRGHFIFIVPVFSPQPRAHAVNHATALGGRDTVKVLMALLDEEALAPPCANKADLLCEEQPDLGGAEGTCVLTLFRSVAACSKKPFCVFNRAVYFFIGSGYIKCRFSAARLRGWKPQSVGLITLVQKKTFPCLLDGFFFYIHCFQMMNPTD